MAPSIQLSITQPNFNPAEKYLMSNSSSDNLPDDSILCFINQCMNMWDIEPAKLVLIFLRQNLLYILANFWDVLPHQPAFSQAIWKVSTTHGKLRTSAWWPAYWLNEILQKQLRYDFSNIAHLYFWDYLQGVILGTQKIHTDDKIKH